MLLMIIMSITMQIARTNACPTYCRCFSSFDGYHISCQNVKLSDVPLDLILFLQITEHQNLIVDLSLNLLSTLPCTLFQISTIKTLILTNNRIETIPKCFSQSSMQTLRLEYNQVRFNGTNILSNSKLSYLDLSHNKIPYLPRAFFHHLRRLRTLILNNEKDLFEQTNDQWLRSLTTRNQLTLIICDEDFQLPLCLFDGLFQSNKLLALELNRKIHCDCSFVYLPLEKIHFHHCQTDQQQHTMCNSYASYFEHDLAFIHIQNHTYRQRCAKEYHLCHTVQLNKTYKFTTNNLNLSSSNDQIEPITMIENSSTNKSMTTALVTVTISRKENISAGTVIPFVFLSLIITTVCLYIILSRRLIKAKNGQSTAAFKVKQKKQQISVGITGNANSDSNPSGLDKRRSVDNMNMNSNPPNHLFSSHYQRENSYCEDETDLTFYSLNNSENRSSSFAHSCSITELDVASLTSTINSSLSSDTIMITNRDQQRIC